MPENFMGYAEFSSKFEMDERTRKRVLEKSILVADLDGTLTPSKSKLEKSVSEALSGFLKGHKLAVISGGSYKQFEKQLLSELAVPLERLANLYLFPTNATVFYTFNHGECQKAYEEPLTNTEKSLILNALEKALKKSGYEKPAKIYGEIIEDRGTQITFSGLGQGAPLEIKREWDPDQEKRMLIRENLQSLIPDFEISLGGMSSIDITKKGIDKAYGVKKISEFLDCGIEQMLFIGDALFEGGNDYPVRKTGIDCIQVNSPAETLEILHALSKP